MTYDQLQADTVVDLITRRGDSDSGERVPEVSVLIDFDTLRHGVHQGSVAETSSGERLPVATIRRLCCDADLLPIVLGGDGDVLDVGRTRRLATRAQRRALRATHRSCVFPGCHVGFDNCRIHHITWWEHGGTSDLTNLVPVCERHHHLVHEGGWILELLADRHTIWRRPDGTIWDHHTHDTDNTSDTPPPTPTANAQHRISDDVEQLIIELNQALTAATNRAPP